MAISIISYKDKPELAHQLCEVVANERNKNQREVQLKNFDLDYHDKPWTLLYLLDHNKFSAPGSDYLFALEGSQIICAAGCYPTSDLLIENQSVSIVMSRMYTVPNRRVQWVGTKILQRLVTIVTTPLCMVTFNQENKGIYLSLTSRSRGLMWPPIWRHFHPLGLKEVNYTEQWCAVADTQMMRETLHENILA